MDEPWLVVASLWWIAFSAAVGLTVGSYLNVVIFRIPRGISTSLPRWSFCPGCQSRIRWHDNLPVLSYFGLRGRCRVCSARISPQYPVIELLTATITLVLLDAFCIARLRPGLYPSYLGLTEQLWADWPIVLAHVILFACLLAMSVIDLEHYFIDIRFTNFAVLMGFVLHALWTPASSREWLRPSTTTAAVSLSVMAGLALVWLLLRIWGSADEAAPSAAETSPEEVASNPQTANSEPPVPAALSPENGPASPSEPVAEPPGGCPGADLHAPARGSVLGGVAIALAVSVFACVALTAGLDAASQDDRAASADWRLLIPLIALFAFVVGAGAPSRASDVEIVDAIESERSSARLVAWQELLLLVPAILCGAAALWLCTRNGAVHDGAERGLQWSPMGTWRPILGLATAASGYVIGGAVGWAVRIGFTLLLGREAFGAGDIHLMAAAGCIAGWPVVVLGFFLTCFLALVGWAATLPFKRTRAIPLVPWLSLAFLAVVVFLQPILTWGPVRNAVELSEMLLRNKSQAGR